MSFEILSSPMKIGKCEIKNRIVMPPMLMGFGKFDGTPTEKLMDYYEERAKGGAGLIMTEITRVNDKTGSAAFAQLAMSHDYHIEPMRNFARRIHRHGAKLFVQLHHPGRQNVGLLVGTVPMSIHAEKLTKGAYGKLLYKLTPAVGPTLIENNISLSSVAPSKCDPAYFAGGRVRALRYKEIKELEQQFIDAAVRVKKADCDGVELHAAHGYLLQQFLSPVTNQRTDEYGGSLENRMRFILNIIHGIKEKCGADFPLIVRLSVDECYEMIGQPGKGYTLEEGVKIAKILEENGVDAIDVSSAGYDTFNYWLEPVSFDPGWRAYMAKAVKEAVSIPVLAANLIRSPEQAEQQLCDGVQDFVSLGRPHIADPHWAEKAMNGGTIKRCICCLNCIESMQSNAYIGSHGECSVNPFVGHETDELKVDGNGRQIVVIGAGPGGLMAAEIAARRGFKVTVFEKNEKCGGQLLLASAPPDKKKTAWMIEDLEKTVRELGVEILLNTPATVDVVKALEPFAVIAATGSLPIKPKFGGNYGEEDLCTAEEVLSGKVKIENKTVAVIGSGLTGIETAQLLAENGCMVTVVDMAKEVAPGSWMQHRDDILPKLKAHGAKFLLEQKLVAVNKGGVELQHVKTSAKQTVDCDITVLALGSRPDNALVNDLREIGINVTAIGDCNKVGKIANATKAAYEAVISL
ncbi:MAG: FAD-dependent oxidoreductase [Eubacterium sp.]|nr:FAD-dependent oxidoreductase [Eubacterium sp.]